MIPLDDRGLLLGDGLFETLLAKAGRLVLFDEHVARLIHSAERLGLGVPSAEMARECANAALDRAGLTRARAAVRLTWTAGSGGRGLDRPAEVAGRLFAAAHPAPPAAGPVRLATSSIRRHAASPSTRLKTLSYLDNIEARREAQGRGADEALMLDQAGHVACAAAANLFWVEGDRLVTSDLSGPVLPGVMRAAVLAAARKLGIAVEQAEAAGPHRLQVGVFLTNSLIGVRAVEAIDGRVVAPHGLVATLKAAAADHF